LSLSSGLFSQFFEFRLRDEKEFASNYKMENPKRTKTFVSYCHRDSRWLDRIRIHLKPLVREGSIDLWDDGRIRAGAKWRDEIRIALESAKIGIVILSADFFASDFIQMHELPALLARAEEDGAAIFTIIASACRFESSPLSEFQAVNSPSRPLSALSEHEQEQVFAELADEIANFSA
jgi:hypothetical protein